MRCGARLSDGHADAGRAIQQLGNPMDANAGLGAATAEAGSGILVAMMIGRVICLATGISAAQVGLNYPVEGGAFIWVRQFGYPTISFIAGCSYILDGILGLGIVAIRFATSIEVGMPLQ